MRRALIVDPSPLIRRVVRTILFDFGYETDEAAKATEAFTHMTRHAPHLVMVDAQLTDVPALDVLRFVRDRLPEATQVLYMPVQFCLLDLQRARAAGATDVLVKPFDRASIAAKVEMRSAADQPPARANFFNRLSRSELVRV